MSVLVVGAAHSSFGGDLSGRLLRSVLLAARPRSSLGAGSGEEDACVAPASPEGECSHRRSLWKKPMCYSGDGSKRTAQMAKGSDNVTATVSAASSSSILAWKRDFVLVIWPSNMLITLEFC